MNRLLPTLLALLLTALITPPAYAELSLREYRERWKEPAIQRYIEYMGNGFIREYGDLRSPDDPGRVCPPYERLHTFTWATWMSLVGDQIRHETQTTGPVPPETSVEDLLRRGVLRVMRCPK